MIKKKKKYYFCCMTVVIVTLTLKAVSVSIILVTLSSLMVSVKAGQGDEWENLERLENSGWLHLEHTYIPAGNS